MHARSAVGVPVLPLDVAGRGRADRGDLSRGARVPLPPQLVEHARAYADGTRTPAEPRNAATVVLLRPGRDGPEVYLLRRQTSMAFAGGMCVFPGGGVDPRDFDSSRRLGRARRGHLGAPARHRGGHRPRAGLRRRTRDVRGVRRAAGRAVGRRGRRRHHRRRLGGRPGRPGGPGALPDRVPQPARPRAALRPARRLGRLADPGVRAAAVPHLVLRRRPPRGPAHPRRLDRVLRGHLAAGAGRGRCGRRGPDLHAAADLPHLPRGRRVRRPRRGAGRRGRPRGRDVHPAVEADRRGRVRCRCRRTSSR